MALDLATLKEHVNQTLDTDDALLTRLLGAAKAKVEADLGFALDDTDELPDGAPADLENAVLMTAADWYENREASIVGVTALPLPFGVPEIIANYRTYTFGLPDE